MRNRLWILCLLLLAACTSPSGFNESFYEKKTGIKLPANYSVAATADNYDFLTISILDLDKASCKKFMSDNRFVPLEDGYTPLLTGLVYLDTAYRQLPAADLLLIKQGSKDGENWKYLIDTLHCRLYCQINYSD